MQQQQRKEEEKEEFGEEESKMSCTCVRLQYFYPSDVTTFEYDGAQELELPREKYLKKTKPLKLVEGERIEVDVYQILSNFGKRDYLVRNNGDRVGLIDAISGKYLLICCFFVPMHIYCSDIDECRAMISTYSKLKAVGKNFEMVMVAKMRTALIAEDEEEPAFNHFFSAFPCLAVPFDDPSSRDLICKRLGLDSDYDCAFVVLDPDHRVLQTTSVCFQDYGAASFPFTHDHLCLLDDEEEELKARLDPVYKESHRYEGFEADDEPSKPVPLEELLFCKPDTILEKCDGSGEKVTVSELSKNKCVGLYLFYDGKFMDTLHRRQRKCVDEDKLEFEIVIVSMACFSDNKSLYDDALELALEKNQVTSWWMLPYVDEVSRRLFRFGDVEDSLIIWTDGGTAGEVEGRISFRTFDKYPFTSNKWLTDRLSIIRSLTLESFLGEKGRLRRGQTSLGRGVSTLKNRNILLCFASYYGMDSSFIRRLRESYDQMKKDYPGSEVVFVPMDMTIAKSRKVAKMPWLRLSRPSQPPFPKALRRVMGLPERCIIVFGANNQIKSLHGIERLEDKEEGVSLFDDTVRQEFIEELQSILLC